MVFPVVMYGCESWTIKKAERWRIDAFELWYCRRLLRVPWTARRSNQSILKDQSLVFIGRTDVKAKTPILWPPDAKRGLIGKDPDAGKDWRQEEKGMTEDGWMASWTQWTWVWVNSRSWWWTGRPGVLWFMGSQRVEHDWVTELNWTAFHENSYAKLLSTLHSFLFSPLSQMLHFKSFYAIFLLYGLFPFYWCSCLYCPWLYYCIQTSILSPGQVSTSAASNHRPLYRPAPSSRSFIQPLTSKAKAALQSSAVLSCSVMSNSLQPHGL